MKAAIIAVGSEMLGVDKLDTNSLKLTSAFETHAIGVGRKSVVGDSRADIAAELEFSMRAADVVAITGGLGPTEDDLTKEAVSDALGIPLVLDEKVMAHIEGLFASRGWKMPEANRKQALVFENQETLHNPRGTAPGFHLCADFEGTAKEIWILPGVPHEMEGLLAGPMTTWLESVSEGKGRLRKGFRIAGMGESAVDERIRPFYEKYKDDPITILASSGETSVHLQADGARDQARQKIAVMEHDLREILGHHIFGTDDESLEIVTGRLLRERRETVSTGESCTGGLLSSRITDIAGSSDYFMGGVIAYTRDAKESLLCVDPALIDAHGEVSEEVAREMAAGARQRFGTTWGIGITGIAGPGGGTEAKPVGTVHVALAGPKTIEHRKLQLKSPRELIKRLSTQTALDMLRLRMMRSE
ncbi:MAG TPA: competence/damage-inducible protein A [Thermoanaerobaculia bacterium]|nr:competence/damage-inducible protein A [Thermoanaerobaculia bacterium]